MEWPRFSNLASIFLPFCSAYVPAMSMGVIGQVVVLVQVDHLADAANPCAVMALGIERAALVPFERVANVEGKVVLELELFFNLRLLPVHHVRAAEVFKVEVCAVGEDVFAVKGPCRVREEGREGEEREQRCAGP